MNKTSRVGWIPQKEWYFDVTTDPLSYHPPTTLVVKEAEALKYWKKIKKVRVTLEFIK